MRSSPLEMHVALRGGANSHQRGVLHESVAPQEIEETVQREAGGQRAATGQNPECRFWIVDRHDQRPKASFKSTSLVCAVSNLSDCAASKLKARASNTSGKLSMRTLLALTASL